jgi:hypothetical protein
MNIVSLLLNRQFALQRGIPDDRALQIGVISAIPDNLATGVVLGTVMTQNAAPAAVPAPAPAVPPPVVETGPQLSGSPRVGGTLACDPGTWTGNPAFGFQWLRDGAAIAAATSSSYTLTADDAGHGLACQVTAVAGGAQAQAVTDTLAVPAATDGGPQLRGSRRVGATLTCEPGTWSATRNFQYQWLRDGTAIAGAGKKTYLVVADDAGHSLACRVTAGGGDSEESDAFAIPAPPVNLKRPSIAGQPVVGAVVVCDGGDWDGDPAVSFHWYAGDADDPKADPHALPGETRPRLTIEDNLGARISCRVKAANAGGETVQWAQLHAPVRLPQGDGAAVAAAIAEEVAEEVAAEVRRGAGAKQGEAG